MREALRLLHNDPHMWSMVAHEVCHTNRDIAIHGTRCLVVNKVHIAIPLWRRPMFFLAIQRVRVLRAHYERFGW